jgi:hypothetical protein
MTLFNRQLSAADKRAVLRKTKELLQDNIKTDGPPGDRIIRIDPPPPLRATVAAALTANGWWNTGVGGHRELLVTTEIQRAVGLERGAVNVDKWFESSSFADVLKGIDTTIEYLA